MTVEDYIRRHAATYPDRTAIVCGGDCCTYGALQDAIDRKVDELRRANRREWQIVCLRAEPTIDYLVAYFACHVAGCVAAPLARDLPAAAFQRTADELCAHDVPKGSADILYTTGTTGRSRGVIVSHEALLADAENLIEGLGFTRELAFVVSGPLNHIGSLSKVYPVVMLGGTVVMVDGLRDMNRFFGALDYPAHRTATFLVPASIRMLLQLAADRLAALAHKIDFIETGAAAMAQADMQALCRLLPDTRLYNTYASTEAGVVSTYNYNDGLCLAGCVGRPMRHSQIVVTEGGLIACKGRTLMTGYVGDNQGTRAVLRDGVLYTSDRGTVDAAGMLHLQGRADDVINVGGFKVDPTEVEDAALSLPDVKDCVCIAVGHKITGKALKLLVVMSDGKRLNPKALALHLKSRLETHKVPLLYGEACSIERTFNGKINRKHYVKANHTDDA